MSESFFKKFTDEVEAKWQSYLSPAVKARLADPEPIGYNEWKEMRLNSWERERIFPKLTTTTLQSVIRDHLLHVAHRPNSTQPTTTYEETVLHTLLPLLLERFKSEKNLRERAECCRRIAEAATAHGWNGTDNSKLLDVFIDEELTELEIYRRAQP